MLKHVTMSNEDESTPDTGVSDSTEEERLEKRRKELEQRERGLDDFAEELDEREAQLDQRDADLRERRKHLDEREEALDQREAGIEEREGELDDREVAIEEREGELSERAAELDRKEQTLQEYVGDNVREAVEDAVASAVSGIDDGESRLGTVGSLVLGLVGIMLIVGGVLNGFAEDIAYVPVIFANSTANLAVTVLLLFSGLAANLAGVAD